jgi:alpha-galactosidase
VGLHKRLRGLLHSGRVVNIDHPDPAIALHGVVSLDQSEAIFAVTALARSATWPPGSARLPELDPGRRYAVRVEPGLDHELLTRPEPQWMTNGVTLSGRVLATTGLELAPLHPEQSCLILLQAV